jgi:o-succinylbenzoate---CoA ligase
MNSASAVPLAWPGGAGFGERLALVVGERELTYAALDDHVTLVARRLSTAVGQGDRVALAMPPSFEFVALVHAVARLGAVVVPLDPKATATELGAVVVDCEPQLIVAPDETVGRLPAGGWAVITDIEECPLGDEAPSGEVDAMAQAAIVYTSGSSGVPKGVVLTFGNFAWSAVGTALRLGHRPGDRWLAALPMHHVGGLGIVYRAAFLGIGAVVHSAFDPVAVGRSLHEDAVTHVSLVPTMLARLLEANVVPPRTLRVALVGGAALRPDLLARAVAAGWPVTPTYGLTEAAGQVATADVASGTLSAAPMPWTQVRIAADRHTAFDTSTAVDTRPAAGELSAVVGDARVEGEILVRGPTVMAGYWRCHAATEHALRGGWLHTGDRGRRDDQGRLSVVGRVDERIVTGGENVDPAEVEAALAEHPGVAEVVVVGLPDAEWGEVVAAAIVPIDASAPPTPADLEAFARDRLSPYKVPKQFVVVAELPRAGVKTARIKAREMFLGPRFG